MCRSSSIARLIDNLFSTSADDQRSKLNDQSNEKIKNVSTHNTINSFFQSLEDWLVVRKRNFAEIKHRV